PPPAGPWHRPERGAPRPAPPRPRDLPGRHPAAPPLRPAASRADGGRCGRGVHTPPRRRDARRAPPAPGPAARDSGSRRDRDGPRRRHAAPLHRSVPAKAGNARAARGRRRPPAVRRAAPRSGEAPAGGRRDPAPPGPMPPTLAARSCAGLDRRLPVAAGHRVRDTPGSIGLAPADQDQAARHALELAGPPHLAPLDEAAEQEGLIAVHLDELVAGLPGDGVELINERGEGLADGLAPHDVLLLRPL